MRPSEKAEKNNASQPLKLKSLSNETKNAITSNRNEDIDSELFDYWVDNLDSSTQDSFISFVRGNTSVIECYLYARFLGYKGAISSCDAWVKVKYPRTDHRKILLAEIAEMQEDIRKLREDIENYVIKRDSGVARIASMQKELRSTIAQIESFNAARDRKGLLMTGADRAIRELLSIFKDDPIEGPLEEASMSVWAKIQLDE